MINCNQVIVEFFAFVDEFSGSPQLQKTFNEICLDKNNDSWENLEYYSNDFILEVEKRNAVLKKTVVISCNLPSFDTLPVEVCQYISTGEKIKDAPEIQAIKNELLTLEISAAIPSIYVAIVGPSFMGKTQTAFALSHSLNLLYVNLSVIYSDTISAAQPIYSPFAKISKIFTPCLQKDMKMIINALEGSFSAAVLSIGGPFLTLGLIYHLICLDKPSSVEEWVLQYINVSDVSVTKLTVSQFDQQIKNRGINLKDSVVFIDELSKTKSNLLSHIKILRNLCRAVKIPVILSGTNAKVQNLIGSDDVKVSRTSEQSLPWVKVVTRLPKATLNSFGALIEFTPWNDSNLVNSLQLFCESNNLNVDLLLNNLVNPSTFFYDIEFLKRVLLFIAEQSKTNLPGLAILSFSVLIELIVELRTHSAKLFSNKLIWKTLLQRIQKVVLTRKKSIAFPEGQLASAHILTFPNFDKNKENDIKKVHESDVLASSKIDDHLFFLGKPNDSSIMTLSANKNRQNKVIFTRDGGQWKDYCHFPTSSQDFIAHMIAWNSWWPEEGASEVEYSLGCIYLQYLNDGIKYRVDSEAVVNSGFALELLSHWAICYASHFDVNGNTSGVDLTREFVKNLQAYSGATELKFRELDMPDSLNLFLSRISAPYLVTEESVGVAFKSTVGQFMKLGDSFRPANRVGWDVAFETFYNDERTVGLTECKLWSRAVDLSLIFKYYYRACKLKCRLSYLVVRSFRSSLKTAFEETTNDDILSDVNQDQDEGNFSDDELFIDIMTDIEPSHYFVRRNPLAIDNLPERAKEVNVKRARIAAAENDKSKIKGPFHKEDYEELWKNSRNHINIYTISSKVSGSSEIKNCSFVVNALKEFENPSGVFIIVQSVFKPPPVSIRV